MLELQPEEEPEPSGLSLDSSKSHIVSISHNSRYNLKAESASLETVEALVDITKELTPSPESKEQEAFSLRRVRNIGRIALIRRGVFTAVDRDLEKSLEAEFRQRDFIRFLVASPDIDDGITSGEYAIDLIDGEGYKLFRRNEEDAEIPGDEGIVDFVDEVEKTGQSSATDSNGEAEGIVSSNDKVDPYSGRGSLVGEAAAKALLHYLCVIRDTRSI